MSVHNLHSLVQIMDQQQTQQTEQIIAEMLEFLETSSEDEKDFEQEIKDKYGVEVDSMNKDYNDNIVTENIENNSKIEKGVKMIPSIAMELKKLRQQLQWPSKVIETENELKSSLSTKAALPNSSDFDNLDWHCKLENRCRRSFSNTYTQEIYKAIYQDITGHPTSGSTDYYQAAENYVLYGKHFLDFPKNFEVVLNDKTCQNSVTECSNLVPNYGNFLYSKPNVVTTNIPTQSNGGLTTAAAAYYQICNSMQTQARPAMSTNTGNSTAYGIFFGNKVTYLTGAPTTPSLVYNQQSSTTTNFISNSLANAALAAPPTILYTNPMLTTTTQQYLSQFLSAAALTTNTIQSATAATNTSGASVYERLVYAQMLQHQIYQTQQAAAVAAMFQHKQRVVTAAATARQTSSVMNTNNNRSSPQNLTAAVLACGSNGLTLNNCIRQARSSSPSELTGLKSQPCIALASTEIKERPKIANI